MDPKTTVELIFQHLSNSDHEEAFYSCLDLEGWLRKGGLGVAGINSVDLLVWAQVTMKLCKRRHWGSISNQQQEGN